MNVVFACENAMAGEALVSGIPLALVMTMGGALLLAGAAIVAVLVGRLVVWTRA